MKKYLILNNGCDDSTETEIELTKKELEILIKFAKENNKNSHYGCQPKIGIYKDYRKDDDGYYCTCKRINDEIIEFDDLTKVGE